MTFISRRDLLKRVAAAPLAGALPSGVAGAATQQPSLPITPGGDHGGAGGIGNAQGSEPLEALTANEMELLDAVVARLIPADANGPGAREARVARYIDRALAGALSASRQAYTAGLAALDRHARSSRGAPFTSLAVPDQDAVLTDVENGTAGGLVDGSAFFAMLLAHARQGMFGDPYYGGNANFIGWDLLGYPGIRTVVTPSDQQRLESNELKSNHRGAYDYEMFTKASK
jgi:gluconate 2-dehydrogenase gamma chain